MDLAAAKNEATWLVQPLGPAAPAHQAPCVTPSMTCCQEAAEGNGEGWVQSGALPRQGLAGDFPYFCFPASSRSNCEIRNDAWERSSAQWPPTDHFVLFCFWRQDFMYPRLDLNS